MDERTYNVLFLCTGNSARSILAESLLNHWGQSKFRAYSAGSSPKDEVNSIALELLRQLDMPTAGLSSKSWEEFEAPGAPQLDFVITVCDNAAGEVCPVWRGHPVTAHWGLPDPAAVEGTDPEKMMAFRDTLRALENRIGPFVELPIASLDRLKLQDQVREIGRMTTPQSRCLPRAITSDTAGTAIPSPSCGTRPPIKSSKASSASACELLTQDTSSSEAPYPF